MSIDTPAATMRLVDDDPDRNGDPVLTTEEVQQWDTKLIRRLAANANTDAISGRSTKLEMQDYFGRQRTLSEWTED